MDKASGAFASDPVAKKAGDFLFVKGTQKLANQYKIQGAPVALIVDPDGTELSRGVIAGGESALTALLEGATAKYASKPVSWGSDPAAGAGKKLLVVGFETEGETLQGFEDRMLAKFHGEIAFVKLPYEKDSEIVKKWGVTSLPTIFLCDASKEAPEKAVLEKLAGAKKPVALKAAVQKALFKLEAKK
jgi:hypothetical protein